MKQVNTFNVTVIAEVMILRTAGMGKFLNRHFKSGLVPEWVIKKLMQAPDKKNAGVQVAADFLKELSQFGDGVVLLALGWSEKVPEMLDLIDR